MNTRRSPLLVVLALAAIALACGGAPPMAMQGTAEDEAAIRGLADRFVAAFNANDPAAIAALVSEDYQAVAPDGTTIAGRAGIERAEGEAMQMRQKMNLDVTLSASTSFLQWIDANNATVGGSWSATGIPEGSPNSGSWLAVAHKGADGQWLMTSSLAADFVPPPPDPAEP